MYISYQLQRSYIKTLHYKCKYIFPKIDDCLRTILPEAKPRVLCFPRAILNNIIGYFPYLQSCFTFMDRGYVFALINMYIDNFSPTDPRVGVIPHMPDSVFLKHNMDIHTHDSFVFNKSFVALCFSYCTRTSLSS